MTQACDARCPDSTVLSARDLERAREHFSPSFLHGISFTAGTDVKMCDVGGLAGVKAVVEETFLWPSLYPELFAQLQLRSRSGLLLYGPPGCGKTHLAAAIATESKLRLITFVRLCSGVYGSL